MKNQIFLEATSVQLPGYAILGYDGIFGLAFPVYSPDKSQRSPLDRLHENGLISHRQFCFILHHKEERLNVNRAEIGSELQLGGCNVKPTTFVRLLDKFPTSWKFSLTSISVKKANQMRILACTNGCVAILDSGTGTVVGPKSEIQRINEMMGAQKVPNIGYVVNCDRKDLPTFTIDIQGTMVELTPKDYLFRLYQVSEQF